MSDYDEQRALQVIKRAGAIRTLMVAAREEGLDFLSDEELKHLEGHIKFLRHRRSYKFIPAGSKPLAKLSDKEILELADRYKTYFRRHARTYEAELLRTEVLFRGLTVDCHQER